MADILQRAIRYYHKHGFKRSMWMLRRKLFGTAPAPQQLPMAYPAPAPVVVGQTSTYFNQFDQALASPKLDPHSKPAPSLFRFGNVAIIGDLNLPQCKKYRVLQKLEAINTFGVASNYSHWQDIPRSPHLL